MHIFDDCCISQRKNIVLWQEALHDGGYAFVILLTAMNKRSGYAVYVTVTINSCHCQGFGRMKRHSVTYGFVKVHMQ